MTLCLPLMAAVVAVAAAVRSTWSPCGLSMLSSITPFSERGKGHSYPATAAWFVVGATVGGATLGLAMAGLALGVGSLGLSDTTTGSLALLAVLVAAGSDSGVAGVHLPVHRRQVNERWLDRYRPWVYGAGFGGQIGCGLATYITTAAVYLMIVLGVLTGLPWVALAVGTGFGCLRGMAVLLTRHLNDPAALRAFHRRFFRVGPVVDRVVVGVEVGSAAVIALWLHTPSVVLVVGTAAVATVVTVVVSARQGRTAPTTCPVPGTGAHPAADDVLAVSGGSLPTG
jgi:hypothetical protein